MAILVSGNTPRRCLIAMAWMAVFALLLGWSPAAVGADYIDLSFNLVSGDYEELYHSLHAVFSDNTPVLQVSGHSALAPMRREDDQVPPDRWVRLGLLGEDNEQIKVLLTFDNIYYLAFSNISGHWHYAKGYEALFAQLDPPATRLPFGAKYPDLLGQGGHKNLVTVPLGKASAIEAVKTLSRYNPSTTPEEDAKLAMAKLSVMICEALRITRIREAFSPNWETQDSFLTDLQAKYTVYWGELSWSLLDWNRSGKWAEGKKRKDIIRATGVSNAEEALAVIDLLLRKPPF